MCSLLIDLVYLTPSKPNFNFLRNSTELLG
jgi:hypothetical protein